MPFRKYTAPAAAPAVQPAPQDAPAMAEALAQCADVLAREAWLGRLVAQGSRQAAVALAGLLTHGDPAVRASAVEGLRRMPAALVRPVLHDLLGHNEADMRIRALDAIERVPDAEVEGWLIALIEREQDANVCGVVVDLLSEMGTVACVPALRGLRLRFASTPFLGFAIDLAIAHAVEG